MIRFTEVPATVGSLEPTPDLESLLTEGSFTDVEGFGVSFGGTLLNNIEPPTPPAVVEAVYELTERVPSADVERRMLFMQGILRGAMQQAIERNLQLIS